MKILFKLIILATLLINTHLHAGKIIKWVDSNGVTHYGDKPPSATRAKKSSVLNSQGITIKKIDLSKKDSTQGKDQREQSRSDKALLASYNSLEEIDIAKERNTKIDKLALNALEQKHENLKDKLEADKQVALEHKKKKHPASADIAATIDQTKVKIKKTAMQIELKKQTIQKLNRRYEQDKIRYAELLATTVDKTQKQ